MKRALVLKHVESEGPARIGELLGERGYELQVCSLFAGEAVPTDLAHDDLLIVMGGPMGVGDRHLPEYPFLQVEIDLIRRRIAVDAPVLGVCLGAQLLAHAAGAAVYPMRRTDGSRAYEVGWGRIAFEKHTSSDDFTAALPDEGVVLHWHGDTFDIPQAAQRFASSSVCPNQAFRLRSRLFGLQFHVEVHAPDVAAFIANDAEFLTLANGQGAVARMQADTLTQLAPARAVGDRLLERIITAMTRA